MLLFGDNFVYLETEFLEFAFLVVSEVVGQLLALADVLKLLFVDEHTIFKDILDSLDGVLVVGGVVDEQ